MASRRSEATERTVKAANRRLYDAVGPRYEELDGRRSPALESWLRGRLAGLRRRAPGGRLLDLGAGSGLVTRCASGLYERRVAMDLSSGILAASSESCDWAVVGDLDYLPFADGSFDLVTCFAALHHLYAFDRLASEVARVLSVDGLFYSDHDLDIAFSRRLRLPLSLYRQLHGASARYSGASDEITPDLYGLAEWQEEGVDSSLLARLLAGAGFFVRARFHWFGLNPIADRVFGSRSYRRGWAPLLSVEARRQPNRGSG